MASTKTKNIYAPAVASFKLQLGPHGEFALSSKSTRSKRKIAERLQAQLEAARTALDADEEAGNTDASTEALEQLADAYPLLDEHDVDISDAVILILLYIIVHSLEGADTDIAHRMFEDYLDDDLGEDQIIATVELITHEQERLETAKN